MKNGEITFRKIRIPENLRSFEMHKTPITSVSILNSSDGQVVRASASGAVDSGLIPSRVEPMTIKLEFLASLHDVQR